MHVRLDQLKLKSLADNIPTAAGAGRVSWRLATFYISYCIKKKRIDQKKKPGYVSVLDGIVTANGEVGISGSRYAPA
jgi:hypothetical protein